ncbi:MAG: hypothetical protein WCR42_12430 [bacterium]
MEELENRYIVHQTTDDSEDNSNPKENVEKVYIIFLIISFCIITYNNIMSYVFEDIYRLSFPEDISNNSVKIFSYLTSGSYVILPFINFFFFLILCNQLTDTKRKRKAVIKILIYVIINIIMMYYSFYLLRNFD